MGLADAWRPQEEDIGVFPKEASGRQLEDRLAGNLGIKSDSLGMAIIQTSAERLGRGQALGGSS